MIVTVFALVVIAGIVAWSIGRRDAGDEIAREEERFPSPTTLRPADHRRRRRPTSPAVAGDRRRDATDRPTDRATDVAAHDAGADAAADAPAPTAAADRRRRRRRRPAGDAAAGRRTTTLPPPTDPDNIARLVPNLAGYAEYLSTPEQAKVEIDQLLATGRHDVAVPGPAATICAAVPMDRRSPSKRRWERDGRRIASSDLGRRDAPGFGECLGERRRPARGRVVPVHGDRLRRRRVGGRGHRRRRRPASSSSSRNNSDVPVCAVRVAPSVSRYFEVYVYTAVPDRPPADR